MERSADRATDPSGLGLASSEGHLFFAVADDGASAIVARVERRRRRGRSFGGRSIIHVLYQRAGRLPLVIIADEIDTSHDRWEYRTEGLWFEAICERPGIHWSYGLEAFAIAIDRGDEMLGRGYGYRTALGWELDFESDLGSLSNSSTELGQGQWWEQSGRVTGVVQLLGEGEPASGSALEGIANEGVPAWLSAEIFDDPDFDIDRPFSGQALRRHWWTTETNPIDADPLGVLGNLPAELPTVDEPTSRVALPLRPEMQYGPVWWIGHDRGIWNSEVRLRDPGDERHFS